MYGIARGRPLATRIRWAALPLLMLAGITISASPVSAAASASDRAPDTKIVLPGATSAEGITAGHGNTFYAGDLFAGDIFKGNIKQATASLFIDAPPGRQAVGMAFDERHDLLFVAGGFTGHGYVYNVKDASTVADYHFAADVASSLVNDVVITRTGVWFTDSFQPRLYFVPIDGYGDVGAFTTLTLSGPAADVADQYNLNGIQATPDGKTLIASHGGNGELYTIDPLTGSSALIAGLSLPNVDGIVLQGRQLWAVQNFSNQISRIKLSKNITSGQVKKVITSDLFQSPTTAALFDDTLAVVNAKFDTGIPPTADEYEIVLVDA